MRREPILGLIWSSILAKKTIYGFKYIDQSVLKDCLIYKKKTFHYVAFQSAQKKRKVYMYTVNKKKWRNIVAFNLGVFKVFL